MAVRMKELLDRFANMEKAAQETLAAEPGALVGVNDLPGSEHDKPVPADAKKSDKEVAQGQPAGAASTEGAVSGGDAKPLNEGKLEVDQALENPVQKPAITDDALTAKEADAHLMNIVGELLADLKAGKEQAQKQAQSAGPAKHVEEKDDEVKSEGEKTATATPANQKIVLDDDTISKIAAAMVSFQAGRKAADTAIKAAEEQKTTPEEPVDGAEKQASEKKSAAIALIKEACVKAAQEAGLNPADAAAAADAAMADAGMVAPEAAQVAAPAEDAAAAAEAGAGDVQIPDDVTKEELATAIIDCVQSGEIDPETAKAIVEEIAGEEGGVSEDQAAEIIADGLESGEITPEQAQELIAAIEGGAVAGEGDVAAADAEAQGAADAAAAAEDAAAEAQGAADAENAIKAAAAEVRANAIQKIASAISSKREQVKEAAAKKEEVNASPLLQKVASILQSRKNALDAKANAEKQAADANEAKYLAGFKKKAEELGIDPQALAKYVVSRQAK